MRWSRQLTSLLVDRSFISTISFVFPLAALEFVEILRTKGSIPAMIYFIYPYILYICYCAFLLGVGDDYDAQLFINVNKSCHCKGLKVIK